MHNETSHKSKQYLSFRINRLTFSSNLHDMALSTRYNIKKLNKFAISLRVCKAPFIEIGCLNWVLVM